MPVSEAIGGVPILSRVFDQGPYFAALAILVMLFGITYPLLCWEWRKIVPLGRLYFNFTINDGIVYPIYMATATVVLSGPTPINPIWTSPLWHWGVLASGATIAVVICWWEVRIGKYSRARQWSLWKLWHTLVFPIAFYWIVSTLPIVLSQGKAWATAIVIAGAIVFALTTLFDGWMPGAERARQRLATILKGAR